MRWWQRLLLRRKMEDELEKEMSFHLNQHTADLIAQGLAPDEAGRRARLALGGPEQVKEKCRDARGTRWLEDLLHDLRYGARMLLKQPGFTLVAVITLASGIGANTTIFSFINGLALRPIAGVKEPERLVAVYTSDHSNGLLYSQSSYPDYLDIRDQADAFSGLAAYSITKLTLTGVEEAEKLDGAYVTGNYFNTLGVEARAGRLLQAGDSTPGAALVAVISHRLWQRRFSGEASVVGRTITLNRRVCTVVGVASESFRGLQLGAPPEFWLPMTSENVGERGDRILNIVGRLKPGVSLRQAQSQITTIGARLARAYPKTNLGTLAAPDKPRPMTVVRESLIPAEGLPYAWMVFGSLLAVVGLVLLIACANVANLLLARASTRRREIAVRLAIGASRWRLVRQLLTESLLLAVLGGGGGLILAFWCSGLLPAFFSSGEIGGLDLSVDWRVLVFTLAASLLTGVLFGLAPALESSRPDLVTALKAGAEIHGGWRRITLHQALVITQVALSLVILIGAGLFIRSLSRALSFDPGFASQNLLIISLDTGGAGMSKEQGQAFYRQALERIGSLPGVSSATLAAIAPIGGGGQRRGVQIEGYTARQHEDLELNCNVVGLNYFNTMGIPLTRGRDFDAQDSESSPSVVIVNEELGRRYFPGQNPIGKRLRFGTGPYREIVGVARSAKYRRLREAPLSFIYIPLGQEYRSGNTLLVRAAGDPANLATAVRREIRGLNRDVLYAVRTMAEQIGEALAADRMIASLLGVFGGIALMLAVVSIYSVVSYAVAQRVREIGVRVALGARGADVLKLVIGQGMNPVVIGVAFGLAMSLALTRLASSLLFEVGATDPATFTGVVALLLTVALAACYIPARRATKVDPLVTLKCE